MVLNCFNHPDDSVTESSVSMEMETGSSNHDNGLISSEPVGLSEELFCGDGPEMGVAEAALQDGEKDAMFGVFRLLFLTEADGLIFSHHTLIEISTMNRFLLLWT